MKRNDHPGIADRIGKWKDKLTAIVRYCTEEVWNDSGNNWKIRTVKVVNLSVRSFLNSDLQSQSCALTYRTLLSIVPALALICAIGRGFGLQDVLMQELINRLPSQAAVLRTAFGFVDSYLSQASGGVFVGVGIIFLFWTLISLLRSIECAFNDIWQVPDGRSIWRMTTDYLAIILMLPILLVCASGISIFMSTSLSRLLPYEFMQPAIEVLFDFVGWILTCMFFAASYMLLPNTKVKFTNAIIPGIIVGTAFQVLQWLFLTGQLYVAKYNAIYGSFSFLPLFLIWMQLVWLFTLTGGVVCYAMQNISEYNYGSNIRSISESYRTQTTVALMAVIAKRFEGSMAAMTVDQLGSRYKLPVNLITPELLRLKDVGLVNFIDTPGKDLNERPVQPAVDVTNLTVGEVVNRLRNYGTTGFIPEFEKHFPCMADISRQINESIRNEAGNTRLIDLKLAE